MLRRWSWIVLSLFVLACGGGGGSSADEGGGGDGTAGGEGGGSEQDELRAAIAAMIVAPERPWSEMSHEDRGTDMVMRFEPVFRVMFQEHDAEEFGHFGCATCHGDDAEQREYHMPSPHLPPVPRPGTPAYQQMAEEHPGDTRFMEERVTPAMQTMLGMGATFTCNGCHPTAE